MTKTIVAIRHAKPNSNGYSEDALRALSEEGKVIQKKVTEEMKSAFICS